MTSPIEYEGIDAPVFGGLKREQQDFASARAVVLPVAVDRTTSYAAGTRNGPREILLASSHMELWDEELQTEPTAVGVYTLPEMEMPFGELNGVMEELERVASAIFEHGKFLIMIGGEHSITPPVVAAGARHFPGLCVLQIDAHADLRDSYMGTRFNHACAMRRTLDHARVVQVGIRSLSAEEAQAIAALDTQIFYDVSMRRDPHWIDRVVEALGDPVYLTIDCDGLDPAIMPAVGTPEPGGLSWYEMLALLRAVFTRRRVVGCDLVELSPIPGLLAPNFLCAKLVYKMLGYRFARQT